MNIKEEILIRQSLKKVQRKTSRREWLNIPEEIIVLVAWDLTVQIVVTKIYTKIE